jgi:hypothetical protein
MAAEKFGTWISPVSQLVGVLVVFGTLITWALKLQNRVDTLETQMHVFLTSPQAQAQPAGPSNGTTVVATPMDASCANLIDRIAAALGEHSRAGDAAAANLRGLMSDLGCTKQRDQ